MSARSSPVRSRVWAHYHSILRWSLEVSCFCILSILFHLHALYGGTRQLSLSYGRLAHSSHETAALDDPREQLTIENQYKDGSRAEYGCMLVNKYVSMPDHTMQHGMLAALLVSHHDSG